MTIHAIAGLPRSGSTLLCNVLNQNPEFYASSTSFMGVTVSSIAALWSNSPVIKSDLLYDRAMSERSMINALRGMVNGWYVERAEGAKHVFDKDRSWAGSPLRLHSLSPGGRLIICVRDLRAVLASIEKQHTKFPILDTTVEIENQTLLARANELFAPGGMLGATIVAIEDLLRRKPDWVSIVKYENFVESPKLVMQSLYSDIGSDWFDHDFDNVVDVSEDVDGLYLNKFPHSGSGKIKPTDYEWSDYVSQDIATMIMGKFQGYNRAFGYV